LAHAGDAFRHGTELDECRVGPIRNDARDRRLAGARRAPEDDAADRVTLDQLAQCATRCEQVLLTDILVERAWAHARGKRCSGDRAIDASAAGDSVVVALEEVELAHIVEYTPRQWPCPTSSVVSQ